MVMSDSLSHNPHPSLTLSVSGGWRRVTQGRPQDRDTLSSTLPSLAQTEAPKPPMCMGVTDCLGDAVWHGTTGRRPLDRRDRRSLVHRVLFSQAQTVNMVL